MTAQLLPSVRTCRSHRCPLRVQAVQSRHASRSADADEARMQVLKTAALSAVAGNMLIAGQASAAQEVATLAGDNRVGLLATLLLPVVGWVGFNIFGPTQTQLDNMQRNSVLTGAGIGLALMLAAGRADAASEVATVAGDNRVGILLALFLPVVGWVLFNIGGPALNQLQNISEKSKKGVIIGAGLGLASLLAANGADAAQEVAAVAGDNRVGILLALFIPVVGWVGFNILGAAKSQLDNMSSS